ncbi:hypothetical protein [Stenotrophomonas cyclobalanopsidis]|uniref:hypothetical protein n=1 Tax=Stenotrophomonas cyclobalanopsidis TaxID=2771362 RepID=UPI0028AE24E5|nr:hypothetical protein [Stenotrophomonas cyclobalanopsidis]
MEKDTSERRPWRSLRRRLIVPVVWGFPGLVLLSLLLDIKDRQEIAMMVAAVWMVGLMVLSRRITMALGPRCGERYYKNPRDAFAVVFFTCACRNCGARPPAS